MVLGPQFGKTVYTFVLPLQFRQSIVCLSRVTFVYPTQPVEIFDNASTHFCIVAIRDIYTKFYGDRRTEDAKELAKYVKGYISIMVKDTESGTIID